MFSSKREAFFDLHRRNADGAGAATLLYADTLYKTPTSWSSDGRFLLYNAIGKDERYQVWVLPMARH